MLRIPLPALLSVLVGVLCTPLAALGGQAEPSRDAGGQGEVSGIVLDANTKSPVPGAIITLRGMRSFKQEVRANADGTFVFYTSDRQRLRVSARAPGYIRAGADFVSVDPFGVPSQRRAVLELVQACGINGHLVDAATAAPVARIPIAVRSASYGHGRRTLRLVSIIESGNDGSFGMVNLPTGEYFLVIGPRPGSADSTPQSDSGERPKPPPQYRRMWWPAEPAGGEGYLLAGGNNSIGNIPLRATKLFSVRVRVSSETCQPGRLYDISFTERLGDSVSQLLSYTAPCGSTRTIGAVSRNLPSAGGAARQLA